MAGLAAFALLTGQTMSGWSSALVTNTPNSVATGALAVTQTSASGPCVGVGPSSSVTCSSSLGTSASPTTTATDSITNNSGSAVSQTIDGSSCGPVQLANSNTTADPMLPRNSVSFAPTGGPSAVTGSGAITFNGTSAYAAGVASSTLGGTRTVSFGSGTYDANYGYGVWFKTTATSGTLFGFGSQPTTTPSSGTTTYDRTLALSAGKLVFTAAGAATATSSNTVNDGAWHYVYIDMNASTQYFLFIRSSSTAYVTMYVDGTSVASTTASNFVNSVSGYWFLGSGFVGSLSNFAVYNRNNTSDAPTSPPSAPYSGADEWWPLNDSGTTTTMVTLPTVLTNACSKVNITFAFTNPTLTIPTQSISQFLGGWSNVVTAPAPGATQTLTITTTPGTGYTSDLAGLRLYVPISFSYGTVPSSNWTLTMSWSGNAGDVYLA